MQITYLACPYTHPDLAVREARFRAANAAAAYLLERGTTVYSPISMTHPIDQVLARSGGTLGSAFWVQFDEAFMECCDRMVILKIAGWEESSGVKRETEWFTSRGRAIEFLEWQVVEAAQERRG